MKNTFLLTKEIFQRDIIFTFCSYRNFPTNEKISFNENLLFIYKIIPNRYNIPVNKKTFVHIKKICLPKTRRGVYEISMGDFNT